MRPAPRDYAQFELSVQGNFETGMTPCLLRLDALWDEGVINSDAIEKWGEEHMRTPYNYEANRSCMKADG